MTEPVAANIARANAAISGNQLLANGVVPIFGPSGLSRFSRDALARDGAPVDGSVTATRVSVIKFACDGPDEISRRFLTSSVAPPNPSTRTEMTAINTSVSEDACLDSGAERVDVVARISARHPRLSIACGLLVLAVLASLGPPSAASAAVPGPPLHEPVSKLAAALKCSADLKSPDKTPVLLVHGTGATVSEDWGYNYAKILPREGYPVCTVQLPFRAMTDVQLNVEYVVYAIRTMAKRSGGKVSVLGHSQGAFLPTYALRFWPDLASKVDDFIGFAGTYTYGTDFSHVLCATPCTQAFRQLTPGSRFLTAIVKKPIPPGPSYTGFSTRLDEVVIPQPMASNLVAPGATNYILQDLCPLDTAEHLLIVGEKPFVQLTMDALKHPGPASLARAGNVSCGLIPETPQVLPSLGTFAIGAITTNVGQPSFAEAPLRDYLQ